MPATVPSSSDNLLGNLGVSIPTIELMLNSRSDNQGPFDLVWSILRITLISFLMGLINQINTSTIISYIKSIPKYFQKPLNKVVLKSKYSTNINGTNRTSFPDQDADMVMTSVLNFLGKSKKNLGESELFLAKGWDGYYNEKLLSDISFGFKPMIKFQLDDFYYTYSEIPEHYSSKDDIILFKTMKTMVIESYLSSDAIKQHIEKIHENYIKQRFPYVKKEYPCHLYPSRDLTQKLVKDSENDKAMKEVERHKAARLVYQKHPLNNRTNFSQLFFPGKDKLLRRLKEFLDPQNPMSKFTLLLYGAPGGGKTSIIKAIQQMCGYDVISVRLNDFRNYEDFFDLFHGSILKVNENGNIANYDLPSNKRLIVMDDVDADNTIVHDRKQKEKEKKLMMKMFSRRMNSRYGSDSSFSDSDSDLSDSDSDVPVTSATSTGSTGTTTSNNNKSKKMRLSKDSSDDDGEYEDDEVSSSENEEDEKEDRKEREKENDKPKKTIVMSVEEKRALKKEKERQKRKSKKNKKYGSFGSFKGPLFNIRGDLQLSDILNILDGINELNKTIIIMTTNHIEKLDPALIRPGRVNWRQEMTSVRYEDMMDIMKNFFGDEPVEKAIKDNGLEALLQALYEKKIMVSKFTEFCVHEDEIIDALHNFETFLSL